MTTTTPRVVAVLDMGASAVRLVIAEILPSRSIRILEEASRGVLLGRDTFSAGLISPQTADATLAALAGFRHIIDAYQVEHVRAVATSAVREARNGELFLDRIRTHTGIDFDLINEAEESRLVFLAVRYALGDHPTLRADRTLLVEVGGGGTSLTLLANSLPQRSGVYALGAIRLRQRLDLRRHPHELQVALLKRLIGNVVDEIRLEIPLREVTQVVAIGGDIRLAASQLRPDDPTDSVRGVDRATFMVFCDVVASLGDEGLLSRFRLPAVEAETLVPALLVYRALLSETQAPGLVICEGSLRAGVLLDLLEPEGRLASGFERQVLASAEAIGDRYRFDRAHGRHVATLATRLFDALRDDHRLSDRPRLLLQVAALLHDVGAYVSLRAHHKHSQYLIAASQIFGLSADETAMVANVARYHRRGIPQDSHLSYIALDRVDRIVVNQLAAILRVANALDAEHLQKVRDVRLVRGDKTWTLELDGTGDLTMEQMAASARTDMFVEVYGRHLRIKPAGVLE